MRDLIMKRTPKDFDIVTSAELKEVFLMFFLNLVALKDCFSNIVLSPFLVDESQFCFLIDRFINYET